MVINLALGQVITEADMTQILASLHTSTETIQEQSDILLREDMAMDKYQDLAKQMKPEIIETWKAKHKKQVEELL